ncbi:hypothetical protein WISP_139257 [Willisornis vidua]|uniref:Uncharacterized protein n=1 Tax=Willisornis vidua TaxID=1566151 RepID=A0ABQ9CMI1_9PASS|nr:hypothetical protein WISP_139257 [Willisornis vidua]
MSPAPCHQPPAPGSADLSGQVQGTRKEWRGTSKPQWCTDPLGVEGGFKTEEVHEQITIVLWMVSSHCKNTTLKKQMVSHGEEELPEMQQRQVQGPTPGKGQLQTPGQMGQPVRKELYEEGPGVLLGNKLPMSEQGVLVAKKANGILGYFRNSIAGKSREVILPFYLALVRITWSAVSSSGLLRTRDVELLEWVQHRETKMIKGLEHLTNEERLSKLGLFSLEKR